MKKNVKEFPFFAYSTLCKIKSYKILWTNKRQNKENADESMKKDFDDFLVIVFMNSQEKSKTKLKNEKM